MALARKCDRCGEFFVPLRVEGTNARNWKYIEIGRLTDNYRVLMDDHYDLCPACFEKLDRFLDAMDVKGE